MRPFLSTYWNLMEIILTIRPRDLSINIVLYVHLFSLIGLNVFSFGFNVYRNYLTTCDTITKQKSGFDCSFEIQYRLRLFFFSVCEESYIRCNVNKWGFAGEIWARFCLMPLFRQRFREHTNTAPVCTEHTFSSINRCHNQQPRGLHGLKKL